MKWLKAKWQQYIDSKQRMGREEGNNQTGSYLERRDWWDSFLADKNPTLFLKLCDYF